MERTEVTELKAEVERLQHELDKKNINREKFELEEKLYNRRVRSVKLVATLMLMFMVVFSIIPVGYNLFRDDFFDIDTLKTRQALITDSFKDSVTKDIEDLRNHIVALRPESGNVDPVDIKLAIYETDMKLLKNRMIALEKSISDSPERALSIPLLRRDQENMSKLIESSRQAVDSQLARIYDQQKWMLTGIGTALLAALTALGGALYRLFSRAPD